MTSLVRRALLRSPRSISPAVLGFISPQKRYFSPSLSSRQATEEAPSKVEEVTETLNDAPLFLENDVTQVDWSRSFHGLSIQPFSDEAAKVLTAPLEPNDVEIKPDGIIYLPEIKYRRILNKAFGPGGWGLAPRSETTISLKSVSREYALVCHGRLVSVARGEQDYFDPAGIATATEGCKSNALMRCCKDLGIASELWYLAST
jgi:Mitochondrial genome maintenance MGM101